MIFFIGLALAFICGLWWHLGRVEEAEPKTKVGVALLNLLGWLMMLWGLLRWWVF